MGNIFGHSNHPIEVKKIRLRLWKLRDEVVSVIRERAEALGENAELINIEDLYKEYRSKKGATADAAGAAPGEEPEEEDEFSKMMADAIANPDEAEAGAEAADESSEDAAEEAETPEAAEGEAGEEGGDDAAAQAALDMMAGQGGAEEAAADPAAQAALDMLAGQGEAAVEPAQEQTQQNSTGPKSITFRAPDLTGKTAHGVTMLSDVNLMDICLFSQVPFLPGQTIIVEFMITEKFSCTAEVITCHNFNLHSRVISSTRPPFRVHARFVYLREGERTLLRGFTQSIQPEIPKDAPKPKAVNKEDDDDFDDLEDLGL
jgi:hypothetical protein